MQGKIVSTIGGVYTVYCNDITYNVFPKGIIKYKHQHLLVGDNVDFDENNLVINSILDRKNELIRPRSANIDQIIIAMSVCEPELSKELLYKFLTYVLMNDISAIVLFTKLDLIKDTKDIDNLKNDLEKLGIKVFYISKNNTDQIKNLREVLKDKETLFMGQSGVGKSSVINLIDESYSRAIGDYSFVLGRGKHKTKEVILLPYENGFIGDTPGFSSLDLEIYKEDLAQFFPGYNKFYTECFYSNCLHQNEKQCKIKEEIEKGSLSKEGYEIYLKLLNSLEYKSRRFQK